MPATGALIWMPASINAYVEPLTVECVEAIIAREKPDAILPTVGGQTALNLAVDLAKLRLCFEAPVARVRTARREPAAGRRAQQVRRREHREALTLQLGRDRVPARGIGPRSVDQDDRGLRHRSLPSCCPRSVAAAGAYDRIPSGGAPSTCA